jgi:hypothetical protein
VKTTLTRNQLIAIGSAVVVVGGGIAGYAASVKNQNCLSYERQLESNLKVGNTLLAETVAQIKKQYKNNDMATDLETMNFTIQQDQKDASNYQQWNNVAYSYDRTCGTGRYDAWRASPAVKPLLDTDNSLRAEIDKLKAEVQAQDVSDLRSSEQQFNEAVDQLKNLKF